MSQGSRKYLSESGKQLIAPIKGILFFLFLSLAVVVLWKVINLDGLLWNILLPANRKLILFESPVNYFFVSKVFQIQSVFKLDTITFKNGYSLIEDPLCTGLKQVIQFSIIMLVYSGPFRKKIWYLPCSWLVLIVAAIFHLVILSLTLAVNPQNYNAFHEHISRWFFFGIFFLLWLLWEEKIVKHDKSIIGNP